MQTQQLLGLLAKPANLRRNSALADAMRKAAIRKTLPKNTKSREIINFLKSTPKKELN